MRYILIFILSVITLAVQAQNWNIHAKYDKNWSYNGIMGKGYQLDSSGCSIRRDSAHRLIIFTWDVKTKGVDTVLYEKLETSRDDSRYDTLGSSHKFTAYQGVQVYHTGGYGDVYYFPKTQAVIRNYPFRFRVIFYNKTTKTK